MQPLEVFIEPDELFFEEVKYVLKIFTSRNDTDVVFKKNKKEAKLTVGCGSHFDLQLNKNFYQTIRQPKFSFHNYFQNECLIRTESKAPDYISTAFYMLNSLQEYGNNDLDDLGRFKFSNSYQSKFCNEHENLVQHCFDKMWAHPNLLHLKNNHTRSSIFLSHDIDSIHGALFQDGFYLLKKGKPHLIFKLLLNELLQRPDWFTFDKIMKIEDEYSFKSTFFWLVNKGRISKREVNADYLIRNTRIQSALHQVKASGWENGIHKSISSETFASEIQKSGLAPIANRNHYLKFNLPFHYDEIEKSGLKIDASLGFAESYGFRNSYGFPFTPFDIKNKKPYSFIEVPLTIMDTTLYRYQKKDVNIVAHELIDFLEKNKFDAVISLLWHNNYFTDYKFHGYLQLYKKLLAYFYEMKWNSVLQNQIIRDFSFE